MISEASAPEWRGPAIDAGAGNHDCVTNGREPVCDPPVLGVIGPNAGTMERIHDILLKLLWSAGIAQEYQLFNWIDHRNFRFDYDIWELTSSPAPGRIEPSLVFPQNIRSILLQSYLHGVTWSPIPEEPLRILKESLSTRLAQRYCRRYQPEGVIAVYSSLHRIDPRNPHLGTGPRRLLLSFGCNGTEPFLDALPL